MLVSEIADTLLISTRQHTRDGAKDTTARKMALSMRFERMTCSLGGSRSIQLSYESLPIINYGELCAVGASNT